MTADRRYTRVTWKIMEQLLEVDSIGDALSGSLEIIYNTLNSEAGAIWLLDKATDRLAPLFHIGPADISGVTVENGLGIEGMVTKTGKSIMVTDAQNDPRFDGTVFDDGGVVANTMLCVPLNNLHEVIGCVQLVNKKDGGVYDKEELRLCEHMASLAAMAIEDKGLLVDLDEKKEVLAVLKDVSLANSRRATVRVAGVFDNYIGRVMVMSRAYYREIFGEDCISNQLYIRLNGADEAKLLEKLMKIDGYDSYGRSDSDKALFASSATLVIAIVALFIFMAAVMAGVVLTNLTNTYILQKKQELTIMRINGFTVREVISYVTREMVFTTIVGMITGIAMGAAIAYRITRSLETAFVQYNRSISLPAWAFGAVITAFFTIVINVIVLRQVRHLSLTDIT